jgi:hypothetical protein
MLGEPATRLCWEDTEKLFLVYLTLAAIEEMEGMANSMRVKETALAGRINRSKRARGSVADAQESLWREFTTLALALDKLETQIATKRFAVAAVVEADAFLFEVCAAVSD